MTPSGDSCPCRNCPDELALDAVVARNARLPLVIFSRYLLKTGRNSPVISTLWASVAKKLRLGLTADARMSQSGPDRAGRWPFRGEFSLADGPAPGQAKRAPRPHRRRSGGG